MFVEMLSHEMTPPRAPGQKSGLEGAGAFSVSSLQAPAGGRILTGCWTGKVISITCLREGVT